MRDTVYHMKKKIFTGSLILAAIVTALMFSSCREKDRLDMIMESGRITFITRNNANCYYIYRDKPMGFEYDLAKKFADYLGVEMDVVVPSWNGMIDLLNSEEGDIIAASWTMTPSRMKKVNFSDPYMLITQQVILHKNNYRTRTIEGLRGRTIHLRSNTSYEKSIKDLNRKGLA